jgi:hypothetical protein
MHSGPVVVVGKQKFSYGLWENTVNVVCRMEVEGNLDQIPISLETWGSLTDGFSKCPHERAWIKGDLITLVPLITIASECGLLALNASLAPCPLSALKHAVDKRAQVDGLRF